MNVGVKDERNLSSLENCRWCVESCFAGDAILLDDLSATNSQAVQALMIMGLMSAL
jgi:hypothetical protein